MKQFNTIIVVVIALFCFQTAQAQLCDSDHKGPNLLGAKGTFSAPYITVNTDAATCLTSGTASYNPPGNVGNALDGCSGSTADITPCSDYNYRANSNGMQAEFTYSILKVMGDENGSNCLHSPIWRAADHTGDGGYFMAVNGAPDADASPLFYQIKRIPVCPGTTYEFSAWVINMMPSGSEAAAPKVSFVVNGSVIATSGAIAYDREWHQVGGSYTPPPGVFFVDLQVINATQVAGGNDLGLDDISFRVCESSIQVDGPEFTLEGNVASPEFIVSDPGRQNTWYKFLFSTDGGVTFLPSSPVYQGTYGADNTFTINYEIFGGQPTQPEWNGFTFRMVVSTSEEGLNNPDCIYFNDYRLIVTSGSPTPVLLTSFNGTYSNGAANLKWQTSQEVNNDRFEILRSFDGNSFEVVGTVAGAGNSGLAKDYQFQDRVNSGAGHVFYKLRQVDKDGRFSFSAIVKLTMNNVAASFQLFPNPVVNNFTASFSAPKATSATLMIRNVSGQTVYSKTVNVVKGINSMVVNNAPLKTGMYYVTISGEEIDYKGKLQKQ